MSYKGRDRRNDDITASTDPKLLNSRVFVGNLPTDKLTRQEVEDKFGKYGKLMGVSLHRGFAFLQYEYDEDAQEAVKQEHGGLYKGNKLDVNVAANKRRDRDDKSARAGGRKRSPFDDRRRDFRDRSPHRDGSADDRQKRFMRDERYREERPREPFYDGMHRRYDDASSDRRYDHKDDSYNKNFRPDHYGDQHRDMYREYCPDPFEVRYPNDCEVIVPNKMQRGYAELVEMRLKNVGLRVDLLFPHEETPIVQVLDDISRRGCSYAVVILPQNEQHKSATVNILWGTPQEHRNMPLDDALNLIARSFDTYVQTVRDKPTTAVPSRDRSDPVLARGPVPAPASEGGVKVLLTLLAEGRPLSVAEIDKIIRHLQEKKQRLLQDTQPPAQTQPAPTAALSQQAPSAVQTPSIPEQQAELQKRILSILNNNNGATSNNSTNVQQPSVGIGGWNAALQHQPQLQQQQQQQQQTPSNPPATVINFDNPNVQKALDNLIQSGPSLLRSLQATAGGSGMSATAQSAVQQQHGQLQQLQDHRQQIQQELQDHRHQQLQHQQLAQQHQSHSMQSIGNMGMGNVGMRNAHGMTQQRHPLLGTPTGNNTGMMGRNTMMGRY